MTIGVPVCIPIRTRIGPPSSPACPSAAAATAPGAVGNATENESPCVSTSTPPWRSNTARSTRRCSANASAYRSGPSPCNSRVDPSTSINTNVTVPLGSSRTAPVNRRRRPPRPANVTSGLAESGVVRSANTPGGGAAGWRTDWRTRSKVPANRHVRAGLENRFGPLGPTRVQIPPPPLLEAQTRFPCGFAPRDSLVSRIRVDGAAVFKTVRQSTQSLNVHRRTRCVRCWVRLANDWRTERP